MSVKKEPNGRRSVEVEIEVPGTPEEVWQAIATGPGISSWMVPTEFEERDGKPISISMNFGPGMEVSAPITAWDRLKRWVSESTGVPGSPPIANEWIVEARDGSHCTVRIYKAIAQVADHVRRNPEAGKALFDHLFMPLFSKGKEAKSDDAPAKVE